MREKFDGKFCLAVFLCVFALFVFGIPSVSATGNELLINEIYPNSGTSNNEGAWFELYNDSSSPIPKADLNLWTFTFAANATVFHLSDFVLDDIPAKGFVVITNAQIISFCSSFYGAVFTSFDTNSQTITLYKNSVAQSAISYSGGSSRFQQSYAAQTNGSTTFEWRGGGDITENSSNNLGGATDVIPPTTTDSLTDSLWHKGSVSVSLTCSDNVACANTYYTLDGTDPTVASSSGTSFSVASDGIYTLKYFSVDTSGNAESVKTAANQIRIDKTKPSNVAVSDSGVWASSPKLTFTWPTSLDLGSGVSYYQFWLSTASNEAHAIDLDPNSSNFWKNVGDVLLYTLTDDEASALISGTTYHAKVKAVDDAGNIAVTYASSWSDGILLDVSVPFVSLTFPASGFYNADSWSGSFSGTAGDADSGVSKVEVKIGDSWFTANGTTTWDYLITPTDGKYNVYYRAYDNAGNVSAEDAGPEIIYDNTAPQVSVSVSPATPDGDGGWYKTSPSIILSASDTNLDKIEYQYDSTDGSWSTYTTPFDALDGEHTIYYRALDKAGNVSPTSSQIVKVVLSTDKPEPIDNLKADASDSLVVLEWDKSGSLNIDYYAVYRSEDKNYIPNPETLIAKVSSNARSYDDDEVDNDTKYYYYVITFDSEGSNSDAVGVSAKPSSSESETGTSETLPIPTGTVLGEKTTAASVGSTASNTSEVVGGAVQGVNTNMSAPQVLGETSPEAPPPFDVMDYWWALILLIVFVGGVGFVLIKKQ